MRHRHVIGFVLLIALAPPSASPAASVSGQVTTEGVGVPGASIFLRDREVRTDSDGSYSILGGPQALVIFAEGLRTETLPVDDPASGKLSESFELVPDLLYSDSLVVTGMRSPLTNSESSVAITTLSTGQIAEPSCFWSLLTRSIDACLDRRVWGEES